MNQNKHARMKLRIHGYLSFSVNALIDNNPAFDSRTKETLIASQERSGQSFEIIKYSDNTYVTAEK